MEMKKFFETARIEMTEKVKEYIPMFVLLGNCIFCIIAAMFAVDAIATNYVGIELGTLAITIHAVLFGGIGGIWLSTLLSRVKETMEIMNQTGENVVSAWKTAG